MGNESSILVSSSDTETSVQAFFQRPPGGNLHSSSSTMTINREIVLCVRACVTSDSTLANYARQVRVRVLYDVCAVLTICPIDSWTLFVFSEQNGHFNNRIQFQLGSKYDGKVSRHPITHLYFAAKLFAFRGYTLCANCLKSLERLSAW